MNKKFYILALCAFLATSPVRLMAEELIEGPESETSTISIAVIGNKVHISGANGETVEIFNIAGVKISTVQIDSAEKVITLSKGCYIIKIGSIATRKIAIR